MQYRSFTQRLMQWLVLAMLLGAGLAMAQSEPNMGQIYATAQSGKLDEAQVMIQQVLLAHPKSSKALFVQAELYARQGKLDNARASLASADSVAPGLPAIKPEAVRALRAQLSARPAAAYPASVPAHYAAPQGPGSYSSSSSSSSWAMPLFLAGGVMVAGYFFFRRRNPEPAAMQGAYGNPTGLNNPQTGYPPQVYPQPAGSGLGGRIMGGVATGLAVGAGVMAAEAIGRNLMGGHNNGMASTGDNFGNNNYQPLDTNRDMGGANFGVNDAGSWDDGGSADAGSGSDWDN